MEMQPQSGPAPWLTWRTVVGGLIIVYGLLLTAANTGWGPAYRILDHWFQGGAAIAIGLTVMLRSCTAVGRAIGGVVALVGAIWLAEEALGMRVRIEQWWPLAIVGFGVLLILRAGVFKFNLDTRSTGPSQASGFAFWSGVQRRIASPAFARGDFAAVMGGVEIDLRPATTAGGTAVIEVLVIWGGIEITVPPDWVVQNEAVVIMGGVEDHSSGSQGAQNTLIIRGLVLMGGVEIKT